jgi:hypothetical protein
MNKQWLQSEDLFLKDNYSNLRKEEIINHLKRTWSSIQSRASYLSLKRINVNINGKEVEIWTKEECNYLKLNYCFLEKEMLIKHLNRSWSSIQNKAFLLKLKRGVNANSKKLLNGDNESFYWLGFLMADGYFGKNGQIQINLSKKDLNHLKKFANFIEYKNQILKPSLRFSFIEIKTELEKKFKVFNNKTYEPCDLTTLTDDSLFSFIIGFIDGDGSISKKGYISIVSHKNWLDNIAFMIKEISGNKYYSCKINNAGFSYASICNIETVKEIKNKAILLKLPILERKWDRVNFNKLSKKEKFDKNKNLIKMCLEKDLSIKDIIKKTGLSKSNIIKHKKLLNEKQSSFVTLIGT